MGAWKTGQKVHIETERFVLESTTRLQATLLTYPWTTDPEIMNPLGYPAGTWTFRKWYREHKKYNNRRRFFLSIRPKGETKAIGYEAPEVTTAGVARLTVVIGDRAWWGQSVVAETRPAVLDFLFDTVGCQRAWGMPAARNVPSVFNYQRLGFMTEGTMRQQSVNPATGRLRDTIIFGMLSDEWRELRKKKAGGI
jgi:ribosomal-protein-alanine N-acetyltransferase